RPVRLPKRLLRRVWHPPAVGVRATVDRVFLLRHDSPGVGDHRLRASFFAISAGSSVARPGGVRADRAARDAVEAQSWRNVLLPPVDPRLPTLVLSRLCSVRSRGLRGGPARVGSRATATL